MQFGHKTIVVFHCLLIAFVSSTFGQEWEGIHYKSELPSPEVYDLVQDTSGFIWICHDNGLSRFDGTEFVSVPGPNNRFSEGVIDVECTSDNRLYVFTTKQEFYYSTDSGFVLAPWMQQFEKRGIPAFGDVFMNKQNQIIVAGSSTYYKFINDSMHTHIGTVPRQGIVDTTDDSFPFYVMHHRSFRTNAQVKLGDMVLVDSIRKGRTKTIGAYGNSKSEIYLLMADQIMFFRDGELIAKRSFDLTITELFGLENGYLMLSLSSGLYFLDPYTLKTKKKILDDFYCSGIYTDKDNGFWVTTLQDGVYYYPPHSLQATFYFPNQKFESISVNDSEVMASTKSATYLFNRKTSQWQDTSMSHKEVLTTSYYKDSKILTGFGAHLINGSTHERIIGDHCKTHYIEDDKPIRGQGL